VGGDRQGERGAGGRVVLEAPVLVVEAGVLRLVEPGDSGEALCPDAGEQPVNLALPVRGGAYGGLGDQQWRR